MTLTSDAMPLSSAVFDVAQNEWMLFLPTDLQISAEIVFLAQHYFANTSMICTHRQNRQDPYHRVLLSKLYNILIRSITGLRIHDFDSSVFLRREVYLDIRSRLKSHTASLSVEIVLMVHSDGHKIAEIPIPHYPRTAGVARGMNWRDISHVPLNAFRAARLALLAKRTSHQ